MKEPITTDDQFSDIVPARKSYVRYQVLAFAWTLAVVTYIHRLGFARGAPEIGDSLGLDNLQVGNLMAAFLVGYGLFQVPGGLLGDRFGGRHILTLLVLLWSFLTAAVAVASVWSLPEGMTLTKDVPLDTFAPFLYLLVIRFLFGAVQAGGFPVLGRVIADWIPITERGFAQGSIWMFSRWGGFGVPILLGWLFAFFGNWQFSFVAISGLGLVWCAAFWPWFRNRPEEMSQVGAAELAIIKKGRPKAQEQPRSVPWARMLSSVSVWSLCLMYGCTGFAGNFFTSMLPLYLRKTRQLDPSTTDWLSGLPLLAGSVACILGGFLSDWAIRRWGNRKWGRRFVGIIGLTLAGICFLMVNWAEETWILGFLLTASFFGNDLIMGTAWASCADIGERYAGTLSGMMNMIGALAGAAGASLAGYFFLHERPDLVFKIFSGIYVLGAICWFGVDVTKRLTWAAPGVEE